MSDQKINLALAFLQEHPDAVAGILEQHERNEVAEFLRGVPQSYAIPVWRKMLPPYAALLSEHFEKDVVAGIFSHFEINRVAAVLRCLPKKQRSELLIRLPAKIQIGCALFMNYSEDIVGGWTTPHVITIPDTASVNEALHQAKNTSDHIHTDYAFVVDRERSLKGCVLLAELLRAEPTVPLGSILRKNCQTLSSRMPIHSAVEHQDWETFDVMPVVDRNRRFIGVLRHVDMRKGLEQLAVVDTKKELVPLEGTSIAQVYGSTLIEIFRSMREIVGPNEENQKQPTW